MLFWICTAIILILCAIGFGVATTKSYKFDTFFLGAGLISGAIAILMMIAIPMEIMTYNQFERSFEIQREIVEQITPKDTILYVADIINANQNLADYQARKELYGSFSIIPKRVLDIKPIGY